MIATSEFVDRAVVTAAERHGGTAAQLGPAEWRLALMNGRPFDATAAIDPAREWLCLDAMAASKPDSPAVWRALAINAALGGHVKFALWHGALRLRAELPLERADVLETRVSNACGAFSRALAALHDDPIARPELVEGRAQCSGFDRLTPSGIAATCRERGWQVTERSSGAAVVDLDCPGRFYQAVIAPRSTSGVSVAADLVQQPMGSPVRGALAVLLLTTAAIVRLARPAAIEDGARALVRLEVVFDGPPDDSDLDHALSALSVGCGVAGDEARALATEAIAKQYIAAIT